MSYTTEWHVVCANGHREYMRLDGVNDPSFTDCPTCGAPRRGERMPPVDEPRGGDITR